MRNQVIGYCPICDNKLKVTKLGCAKCGTELSGQFHLGKFAYLKEEELRFVELFVKNAGNMKQLQNELGVSYPTAKKMLNDVIKSLGYQYDDSNEVVDVDCSSKDTQKLSQAEILKLIEDGEISPDEGLKLLES